MAIVRKVIILAAAFASSMLPATAQNHPPAKPVSEDEADVIRVSTRLVTVPVSVRGRDGRYVTNLRREDFRIYEDGGEQQAAHFEPVNRPIEVIMLLDYSVSLRAHRQDIRGIATDFLDRLRPDDRARAAAFGSQISILTDDSHDRPTLRQTILNARVHGGTALYDAVLFIFRHLIRQGGGRKAIILFTDGLDNASRRESYEESVAYAEERDAPVHVVKYGKLSNTERGRRGELYLRELADKSGGRYYFAEGQDNMLRALGSIAEELRAQYTIGYYPAAEKRGNRRKIKVRVKHSGMAVRARDSYLIRGGVSSSTVAKSGPPGRRGLTTACTRRHASVPLTHLE